MAAERGRLIGYARGAPESLGRQTGALLAFGVAPRLLLADGPGAGRPRWRRLVGSLRAGDVLAVAGIGALGDGCAEMAGSWRAVVEGAGADIVVLDVPGLDTRLASSDSASASASAAGAWPGLVADLLGSVSRAERDAARARQAEGIASARARGVVFGRPRKEQPALFGAVRAAYLAGDVGRAEAARALGVSERTFSRWVAAAGRGEAAGGWPVG